MYYDYHYRYWQTLAHLTLVMYFGVYFCFICYTLLQHPVYAVISARFVGKEGLAGLCMQA